MLRQRANTKEEDPTGLLNEGHRYRDLETGTWLSRDPADFIDGPNLYAYVKQNPWSKFDPEGLHGWEVGPTMEQAAGRAIAEYVHNDPKQAASLAADFVPVVGTVKGITEAVGGKDPVTGKQLSNGEQAVAGVGAVASLLPGGKAVVKGLSKLFKGADKAADIAKTVKEVPDLVNSAKKVAQGADEAASRGARFGSASSKNYRGAFFEANPGLEGQVVAHHAVEQQALTRFPGTVTEAQIHSLENLRGIPKSINSDVHLSQIRKSWNEFYRNNPAPTQQQLLDHATNIDDQFGHLFNPLVR